MPAKSRFRDAVSRGNSAGARSTHAAGRAWPHRLTEAPAGKAQHFTAAAFGCSREDSGDCCIGSCRRLEDITRLVVELDDAAAQRLTERAAREGIEPSALAQRLLSEASEVDPFEFVGSFAPDSVAGRDTDAFLDSEGFGSH